MDCIIKKLISKRWIFHFLGDVKINCVKAFVEISFGFKRNEIVHDVIDFGGDPLKSVLVRVAADVVNN